MAFAMLIYPFLFLKFYVSINLFDFLKINLLIAQLIYNTFSTAQPFQSQKFRIPY
mgnify:CR=1 FL=1